MNPKPITTWFEIPSHDYNRAVNFYEQVFQVKLAREEAGGLAMAVFPHEGDQTGGAVVNGAQYKVAQDGVCVYLYSADFDATLLRIAQQGGTIVLPKMSIGPNGFIAHFIDSEGNRLGLHTFLS